MEKQFELFTYIEPDGDQATNYLEEIEDQQCELCLEFVVLRYYIQRTFKRHVQTKRCICNQCQEELKKS